MISRNVVGIETGRTYATIELYEGDVVDVDSDTDVLVASAFAGGYEPTLGTVFGALRTKLGCNVEALSWEPDFDFRVPLSVWVSRELPDMPFNRLVCAEFVGSELSVSEVIQNVFAALSLLEAKGIPVRKIALPVLGAGLQGLLPEEVMAPMLEEARRFAQRSLYLEKISFVEINPSTATVLSEGMDRVLGRIRVSLPKSQILAALRKDVESKMYQADSLFDSDSRSLRDDWLALLSREDVRSVELGVQARRLVELLVRRLGDCTTDHLNHRIRKLEQSGSVAPWICGYMNVLRHLGNESAHEPSPTPRRPPVVESEDLALSLFCVARLLDLAIRHPVNDPLT